MNIRSIDLQVLIPRATEASRMQQTNDQHNSLQQQQFAEQLKNLTAQRQQQVQNTPKNEGPKIQDQERQKQQQQQQENDEKKGDSDNQETPPEVLQHAASPSLGHRIDIKT
ncbi:MAG: hypothetical protein P4N41_24265 [Negativicutes bacterium]|nr:hypothetical protein [Negativicutes bacterium]